MDKNLLINTPLGKETQYSSQYNPALLCGIPRDQARKSLQILELRPFKGVDIWRSYEFSWLNVKGKPQTAIAEFFIPDDSTNIIESKSFKLYLNSFSQTPIVSNEALKDTLQTDLSKVAGGKVEAELILPEAFARISTTEFTGISIDNLDITTQTYRLHSEFLHLESMDQVEETLYSHLFRSNCPLTNQPDWASVLIRYCGKKISHGGLLKYLISFREFNDFHEQCAEQIFVDILRYCAPENLTVQMCFTRRGGLDINPFRSNFENVSQGIRTFRQ